MGILPPNTTWRLFLVIPVVTFGTGFSIYSSGVVNNAQVVVRQWVNRSYFDHYDHQLSGGQLDALWSITSAAFYFGGTLGPFLTRLAADRFGRCKGLIVVSCISCTGCILAASSYLANSFEMLIIGRFIIGVGLGLGLGVGSMFITEIPIARYRGACATVQQVFLGLGDLSSLVATLPHLLGSEQLWPYAFALPIIPAILMLLVIPWCPDSPRYLYFKQNCNNFSNVAEKSIEFYQTSAAVSHCLAELESEKSNTVQSVTIAQLFREIRYRKPLLISVFVVIGNQLGGVCVVFPYSTAIFIDAGLSTIVASYASVGLGLTNFIVGLPMIYFIETVGRRKILFTGLFGCLISFSGLSIITACKATDRYGHWLSYLSIVALIAFQASYAICAPIAWLVANELFDQASRALANSFVNVLYWGFASIFVFVYLPFQAAVGVAYSFLPFLIFCLVSIIYLYAEMPETRGLSIEEVVTKFNIQAAASKNLVAGDGLQAVRRPSRRQSIWGPGAYTGPAPLLL